MPRISYCTYRTIPEKLMSSFSDVVNRKIIFPNSDASAAGSDWRVYSLQFNFIKVMQWSRNSYLKDLQNCFINISFRPLLFLDPFDCVRVFG